MKDPDFRKSYLEELKDFFAFSKNLWSILAGVSVFFPLSNILLDVIPLGSYGANDGVYDRVTPKFITTSATVITLFVILATYTNRREFQKLRKRGYMLRKAWLSLIAGTLSLIIYLIIYQVYSEYAWVSWNWRSGDPRKLFAEIPLLIFYVIFFSLLTRAFMILGMIEFFGKIETKDKWDKKTA
jgi:hypothetical protein